jgi:hypothetical protein
LHIDNNVAGSDNHNWYVSCQYLAQCVVGASVNEGEEEEEEGGEEEQKFDEFVAKEGCYEIIGTVKDPAFQKPKFIKEILQVNKTMYERNFFTEYLIALCSMRR